uniref:DHFR domain-containing protein n=1 Tax=viral metagenome TaxID=1070528 RepID=A0A6C0KQX4_9ZZZZ
MIEVILACTPKYGIGFNCKLPWHDKEELMMFQTKTMDSILIVGRKTAENLPPLKNRTLIIVSKSGEHNTVQKAIEKAYLLAEKTKKIFVIGGGQIYNEIFYHYSHLIDKVHISTINEDVFCDTFVNFPKHNYRLLSFQNFNTFIHEVYEANCKSGEIQYLSLLREVLDKGNDTFGRNGAVKSLFGKALLFDLSKEFPLLTTKKMFLRGIIEELIFFLKGQTNSKILEQKKVNIWKGNTEHTHGFMGPMYGSQWRHFNAAQDEFDSDTGVYKGGYDQLNHVINTIKNEPKSRRILMTTFNPAQAHLGVLYPCHSIVNQFYVEGDYLDMTCYNRSSDLFLGLPFNIASSSLLLHIIAKMTNLRPRYFHLYLGDCHIYELHKEAVKTQLARVPLHPPQILLCQVRNQIEDYKYEDFSLQNYQSFSSIKAEMVK